MAVAYVTALVVRTLLTPLPAVAATIFGVASGAFLAGRWAKSAGVYHGAVVAAGFIVLQAVGLVPDGAYAGDAFADTVTVIVLDAATLLAGAIAGWLAWREPSSSSGTGRGR